MMRVASATADGLDRCRRTVAQFFRNAFWFIVDAVKVYLYDVWHNKVSLLDGRVTVVLFGLQ